MNRLYRFGTLFFAGLVAFGFCGCEDGFKKLTTTNRRRRLEEFGIEFVDLGFAVAKMDLRS